ncbi:small integral membrane protein 20 isoform X1 [Dendrobates tinctorius]|uniref:small integral membrane protein 20 isoform X1 n=1 Tax=Dendrobates tinctorius TaxID=92724 RepID=UPI003CC969CF
MECQRRKTTNKVCLKKKLKSTIQSKTALYSRRFPGSRPRGAGPCKKEQAVNRAGVDQESVQPVGLKVWSDPFSRK